MNNFIHLLPIICSLTGAVLCILPVLYFERIITVVSAHAAFFSAVYILFQPDYMSGYFYVDGLSKLMNLTISMIYISTVLYSMAYLKHIKNPLFQKRLYFFLLNVFAATMFFSVSMDNVGLIWVGIEATTVSSALLVATENDQATVESAWRYVIIVSTGLVISLIATTFIYGSSGTLSIAALLKSHPDNRVFLIGMLLALVGFGTKAGIFPMHTWLPDVHGKAPSPVSAIFSGVLLPVALYAMARIIQIDSVPVVKIFALVLGILTVGVAALMLTVQNNYKRMFAYSSMENMGMILIGFSLGKYGLMGAMIKLIGYTALGYDHGRKSRPIPNRFLHLTEISMEVLIVLCGVGLPAIIIWLGYPSLLMGLLGVPAPLVLASGQPVFGVIAPTFIALIMVVLLIVPIWIFLKNRKKVRKVHSWNGGVPLEEQDFFTASAYSQILEHILRGVFHTREVRSETHGGLEVEDILIRPTRSLTRLVQKVGEGEALILMNGKISAYVTYILVLFILVFVIGMIVM